MRTCTDGVTIRTISATLIQAPRSELYSNSFGNVTPGKYSLFSKSSANCLANSGRRQYKVVVFPANTDLIARAVPQLPEPTTTTFID